MREPDGDHRGPLLARLKRIHQHRQQARERELAQQRMQLDEAARQLAEQKMREQAAAQHFAQLRQQVEDALQKSAFTGTDALRLHGYLAVQRSVYEAEVTAVQAAESIVQVAQDDVQQARMALHESRTALQKAEQMHERVTREIEGAVERRQEIEVDADNMAAHVHRQEHL